ncbi:alpha/beta hydrolase [Streptomyces nojiriensis]|uniref:alpha/beta hydrolase n=1 Tax=Streptomyces nojiriensis TaxID=66374 RepID=UPI0035E17685
MHPATTRLIVLPGGGYASHAPHEAEPIVAWLSAPGLSASVFRYPLQVRYPEPLLALRAEIRRRREQGAERIGVIGFSAGGHLAGLAALAPGDDPRESVQFAVLGYAITSMETETYRPARLILLGEDASPDLRRRTSLDALVTEASPPFFLWHTAEDMYVPPEHTCRLASALAAYEVPHTVHVFAHGPHSLGAVSRARRAERVEQARPTAIRTGGAAPGGQPRVHPIGCSRRSDRPGSSSWGWRR